MIRAALEGVIFSLYSILPAVENLIGPTQRMMANGGFVRSALWLQLMADIFNREVVVPESVESSCLGAAVLGLYALGKIESLEAIAGMVGATHRHLMLRCMRSCGLSMQRFCNCWSSSFDSCCSFSMRWA